MMTMKKIKVIMKYFMSLIWKIIKFYVKWHPCLTVWWIFCLVFCVWSGSKYEESNGFEMMVVIVVLTEIAKQIYYYAIYGGLYGKERRMSVEKKKQEEFIELFN